MSASATSILSDGIRNMLVLDSGGVDNEDGGGRSGAATRRRGPLIQIVDDGRDDPVDEDDPRGDDESGDDDDPPPISFHGNDTRPVAPVPVFPTNGAAAAAANTTDGRERKESSASKNTTPPPTVSALASARTSTSETTTDAEPAEASSLMERMVADAAEASKSKSKESKVSERKEARKATCGFKKGFLNSSSSKMKSKSKSSDGGKVKTENVSKVGFRKGFLNSGVKKENNGTNINGGTEIAAAATAPNNDIIYELDADGNMLPSVGTIPGTTPIDDPSGSSPDHPPPSSPLDHLRGLAAGLAERSDEWATPDLMETLHSKHPKLAARMSDPECAAALEAMRTRPKETLEEIRKDRPEVLEFLNEFCAVVGEHFVRLGEAQERERGGDAPSSRAGGDAKTKEGGERKIIREMGPLEEEALKKHRRRREEKKEGGAEKESKTPPTKVDEPRQNDDGRVAAILADENIRTLLLDPEMQRVMQECGKPGQMRRFMHHPEYGPKLRRLMDAGLLRVG